MAVSIVFRGPDKLNVVEDGLPQRLLVEAVEANRSGVSFARHVEPPPADAPRTDKGAPVDTSTPKAGSRRPPEAVSPPRQETRTLNLDSFVCRYVVRRLHCYSLIRRQCVVPQEHWEQKPQKVIVVPCSVDTIDVCVD